MTETEKTIKMIEKSLKQDKFWIGSLIILLVIIFALLYSAFKPI